MVGSVPCMPTTRLGRSKPISIASQRGRHAGPVSPRNLALHTQPWLSQPNYTTADHIQTHVAAPSCKKQSFWFGRGKKKKDSCWNKTPSHRKSIHFKWILQEYPLTPCCMQYQTHGQAEMMFWCLTQTQCRESSCEVMHRLWEGEM